jgi:hypothetical protein
MDLARFEFPTASRRKPGRTAAPEEASRAPTQRLVSRHRSSRWDFNRGGGIMRYEGIAAALILAVATSTALAQRPQPQHALSSDPGGFGAFIGLDVDLAMAHPSFP